jgi:hypothetical protein
MTLTLPDGSRVVTTSLPLGELIAAHRASSAPDVVAATSELPTGTAVQVILPIAIALLRIKPLREFAKRRLAGLNVAARARPREYSWGHASVHWSDGTNQQGWLRIGDAGTFTTTVAVKVAELLLQDKGRPGAYTPGVLFGPELAEAAGGTFLIGG